MICELSSSKDWKEGFRSQVESQRKVAEGGGDSPRGAEEFAHYEAGPFRGVNAAGIQGTRPILLSFSENLTSPQNKLRLMGPIICGLKALHSKRQRHTLKHPSDAVSGSLYFTESDMHLSKLGHQTNRKNPLD